ncbi:MAG: glycosyltransferase family 9 protein, partial [Nitrospinales bacterium]
MSNNFGRPILENQQFNHILLWMPNWIGDVVLVIPSIQALRKRYPEARITAVTRLPASELLSHLSFVDSVIHISFSKEDSFLDQMYFARRLGKYGFDLALVFPNSWRSAFMVYLSGTKHRLGYATEKRGMFLTHPQRATPESKTKY